MAAAAVWMGPGNLGCGSGGLGTTAAFAPSRAARRAIASPIPRLAPVMNSVLPAKLRIAAFLTSVGRARSGRGATSTLQRAQEVQQVLLCLWRQGIEIPDDHVGLGGTELAVARTRVGLDRLE